MDIVIGEPKAPDATARAKAVKEPVLAKASSGYRRPGKTPPSTARLAAGEAVRAKTEALYFKRGDEVTYVGGSQATGIKAGVVAKYYGTCLTNGNHRPGSEAERECPLRNAAARSARSKKAARTRKERLHRLVQGKDPDRAEKV